MGEPDEISYQGRGKGFERLVGEISEGEVLWQIADTGRDDAESFVGVIVDPDKSSEFYPKVDIDRQVVGITFFDFRCTVNIDDGSVRVFGWDRG
ncbi:hypothetical protein [Blastopirellula marina]|uniref:Uncharacterized protein n=1 Tax=Blastopirellula marina TaxID=124 RepID=A0A2S8GPX2_9BACT|nr:hypothetical protein [Blastopirellula marina]PQO46401.1 hypothetical protein C5Y93_10500 [Blastopirellula marina]